MKHQHEYEWVVLARYITKGDGVGLGLLRREWFTGLARDVYDITVQASSVSPPYIFQELRDRFTGGDADEAIAKLQDDASIDDTAILSYVRAISHRYAVRGVRDSVMRAHLQLEDGDSALRVRSQLMSALEDLYEISPVKDFRELREEMQKERAAVVRLKDPRFVQAQFGEVRLGNLFTIGGPSGSFKTTLTTGICDDVLTSNPDAIVVYFSKEQPGSEIAHKFIAKYAPQGVTYGDIVRYYNVDNPSFVERCDLELESSCPYMEKRLIIVNPTDFSRPEDIGHILQTIDARGKKLVWVVDYVTLLNFGKGNKVEQMEDGLAKLKEIVHQTQSLGILISQLVKGWNLDFKTQTKIPMIPVRDNLVWASALSNLSAYILLIYRPYDDDKSAGKFWLFTRVDKMRFADKDNLIVCNMDVDSQRVVDVSPGDMQLIINYIKAKRM